MRCLLTCARRARPRERGRGDLLPRIGRNGVAGQDATARSRAVRAAGRRSRGEFLVARQLDMKRQAPGVVPRGPDAPAVGLDDRAADGQPHPQPLGLAADEVLEDSLQLGCARRRPRCHGSRRRRAPASGWLVSIRISRGPSAARAMASPALTTRFRTTCLELNGIAEHGAAAALRVRSAPTMLFRLDVAPEQGQHVVDQRIDVHRGARRRAPCGTGRAAGVIVCEARSGVVGDVGERLLELRAASRARMARSRRAAWAFVTMAAKRLVDLVGDRHGQLAQGRDAQRVRQLVALTLRLLLGLPATLLALPHGARRLGGAPGRSRRRPRAAEAEP